MADRNVRARLMGAPLRRTIRRVIMTADHRLAHVFPARMWGHLERAGVPFQPGNGAAVRRHDRIEGTVLFVIEAHVGFDQIFPLVVAEGEDWRSNLREQALETLDAILDDMKIEDCRMAEQSAIGSLVERGNRLFLEPPTFPEP